MMNGPLIVQKDDVDKVPKTPTDSPPWLQVAHPRRQDWRVVATLCAFGLIGLLLLWWLIGADVREWVAYSWGGLVVKAAIGGALALVALHQLKRLLLVEQPGGYKLLLWQTAQANGADVIGHSLRVQETYAGTPFRNVAAYTLTQPQAKAIDATPQQIIDMGALPAPGLALAPDDTWLPWLLEVPHTMIAGSTGTGKTTLARIAVAERLRAGYAGIVVDPKGKEWFGLPVVGGGRKFPEILGTLDDVRAEMGRRFEAYGNGERSFSPLVIVVDEVPDIMDACLDDRRRLVDGRWSRFVRQLGSLAREVQISVILLTQSPLVEDIGMNSAMRKNFSRIALGDEAPILIREERDPKRRAELQNLLRGQGYPAAMYRRGEVHLLDTVNVPSLAARGVSNAQAWQPTPRKAISTADAVSKYQAWARRLDDAAWRAEVQRLATLAGDRRGGYKLTIEQIRALVGRDQNVVATLVREARGG